MINKFRKLDYFTKNVLFVFFGSSLTNVVNLIYQLLIAHKLSPQDFAAFNSLLAIAMLLSNPLGTFQLAVAKYCSDFNARGEHAKVKALISGLLKKGIFLALATFIVFIFLSFFILKSLKINSYLSGFILALMLAFSWISPILSGGLQGLKLFGWLVLSGFSVGVVKLAFTVIFIALGFKIAGTLGAFLISIFFGIIIGIIPLRRFLTFEKQSETLRYKEIVLYFLPIAISNMCFIWLVSFDMVLVRYFFSNHASGIYSLAQMVGKIFLFLPSAISVVMFPHTSGLNATNSDTRHVLKKSLRYAFFLCVSAALFYNIFPALVLRILTGKTLAESVMLGRFFSVSMTFFALSFVLINYLLSIKSFDFVKYLVVTAFLQLAGIVLFHHSLLQVQAVLCLNSFLLFVFLLAKYGLKPAKLPSPDAMQYKIL